MKNIICMIPAKLSSSRIKHKNLRYLGGKPLIAHAIDAAKNSSIFQDIYVNSESDVFGQIAAENGVKFYKRPQHLSEGDVGSDEFCNDFLINHPECDILVQLLPTSPFIDEIDIRVFVNKIINNKLETLVSVSKVQIECLYKSKGINFEDTKQSPPSQTLEPIFSYACGLMGWERESYLKNMKSLGCAYHGANTRRDYVLLDPIASIDIDEEEDFQIAEAIIDSRNKKGFNEKSYYSIDNKTWIERDIDGEDYTSILTNDGVNTHEFTSFNNTILNVDKYADDNPGTSWCKRVINSDSNSATLICQAKGEGNRRHYHNDWNEFWYIVRGSWNFEIEGEVFTPVKGDVVFIPKNKKHQIKAIGDGQNIRLAVSREDVNHIYHKDDTSYIFEEGTPNYTTVNE